MSAPPAIGEQPTQQERDFWRGYTIGLLSGIFLGVLAMWLP